MACELAVLLMVVEECEIDSVGRENLISLARRVSDQLAASMVEQNSVSYTHLDVYKRQFLSNQQGTQKQKSAQDFFAIYLNCKT